MPSLKTFRPDPMPVREALRGLKSVVEMGSTMLSGRRAHHVIPRPASEITHTLLGQIECFARNANQFASTLLEADVSASATLSELQKDDDGAAKFARLSYAALKVILPGLRLKNIFISELAARLAFSKLPAIGGEATEAFAARLSFALADAGVVRGETPLDRQLAIEGRNERLAIFALMLWFLAERSDVDGSAALGAAADLALALSFDVERAMAVRDQKQLADLYARYATHV